MKSRTKNYDFFLLMAISPEPSDKRKTETITVPYNLHFYCYHSTVTIRTGLLEVLCLLCSFHLYSSVVLFICK